MSYASNHDQQVINEAKIYLQLTHAAQQEIIRESTYKLKCDFKYYLYNRKEIDILSKSYSFNFSGKYNQNEPINFYMMNDHNNNPIYHGEKVLLFNWNMKPSLVRANFSINPVYGKKCNISLINNQKLEYKLRIEFINDSFEFIVV